MNNINSRIKVRRVSKLSKASPEVLYTLWAESPFHDSICLDDVGCVRLPGTCSDCSKIYIGQSGRSLKHRLSEHRWALQNEDVAASALAEHTWSTGHHVDLSKAEVVDTQPFETTQCLLESWHIQRHPDTLNRERGTLPREYTALLD